MNEILGKRIIELRMQNRLTQKQMAEQLGVAPASLSGYEKNQKAPTLATVQKIAETYGVSMDWLCGLADQPKPQRTISLKSLLYLFANLDKLNLEYTIETHATQNPGRFDQDTGKFILTFSSCEMARFAERVKTLNDLHDMGTFDDFMLQSTVDALIKASAKAIEDEIAANDVPF